MKNRNLFKSFVLGMTFAAVSAFSLTAGAEDMTEAETAGQYDDLGYENIMSELLSSNVDDFNNLAAGETIENEISGIKYTVTKPQENIKAISLELPEGSLNTNFTSFFCKHGENYMTVQYFTNADGVKTITVSHIDAETNSITPIYASTNDDETASYTADLSDYVQGLSGNIEIEATQNEDGSVSKVQTITNDAGEEAAVCYAEVVTTDEGQDTDVEVTKDGETIATICFQKTNGDTQTYTVTVEDEDASTTLTYEVVDGVIDLESATVADN